MNPEDNSSNALPEVQPDFPLAQLNSAATKPPDDPIYILPSNHWSITRAAKRLFRALAPLQVMFVHFGVVVELILEPVKKQYQLNPIKPDQAASRFERVGQLWKHVVVKDKVVLKQSICSEAIAKLLLGTREALELLYPITMVVNSPVLVEGPDGKCAMLAAG